MSVRAVSLETVLDGGMVWASVHVLAVRDSLKMVRCKQDASLGQEGSEL